MYNILVLIYYTMLVYLAFLTIGKHKQIQVKGTTDLSIDCSATSVKVCSRFDYSH